MHPDIWAASGEDVAGQAGIIALATIIGGGIKWLWDEFANRKEKRRKEDKEDEETAISRLEKLVNRLDEERKQQAGEIEKLRTKCTTTEVTLARAVTWIKLLQGILQREKIPHPQWSDDPTGDTDTHAALQDIPRP